MNNYPNPNDQTTPVYQNPYPPPPRQPPRLVQWYRAKMARRPVVTGCLTAVAALVVLLLCGTISGIANGGLQSLAAMPTPTPVVHHSNQTAIHATLTATPKPTSTPVPTMAPTPTATAVIPTPVPTVLACSGGVTIDGACYSTIADGGSLVYSPVPDFCTIYTCIANFDNGTGYVVECGDQQWSHSGGKSGACSRNGGVIAVLYQH